MSKYAPKLKILSLKINKGAGILKKPQKFLRIRLKGSATFNISIFCVQTFYIVFSYIQYFYLEIFFCFLKFTAPLCIIKLKILSFLVIFLTFFVFELLFCFLTNYHDSFLLCSLQCILTFCVQDALQLKKITTIFFLNLGIFLFIF